MYSDLHLHSSYSDGSHSPTEIVSVAEKRGIQEIALTDHSTVQGIREFMKAAKKSNIEVISGVEISSSIQNIRVHILGYFVDIENNKLNNLINKITKARSENTRKILENSKLSYSWDRVLEYYPNKQWIGCSDIYKSMLKDGYLDSSESYWNFYEKYCMGKDNLKHNSPKQAIEAINEANGIPILAHPGLIGDDSIVESIINSGIKGLEVYHPDHDRFEIEKYSNWCKKEELLITGGTDWHGNLTNNDVDIGDYGLKEDMLKKLYEYYSMTSDNKIFS